MTQTQKGTIQRGIQKGIRKLAGISKSFLSKKIVNGSVSERQASSSARKHIHPVKDRVLNQTSLMRVLCVRFVSVMMIMSLLVTSNPAAPETLYYGASGMYQDARFSYMVHSTGVYEGALKGLQQAVAMNPVLGFFFAKRKANPQKQITRIEIVPGNVVIREGEQINFSAIAYDSRGNVVQGAEFTWLAAKGSEEMAIKGGLFESGAPGIYWVGAKAGGVIGTKRIVVREDIEYRAMKEIRRQERKAAESKAGISTGNKTQKKLRKEVLDEVERIKANRPQPISNSTRMSKADKATLKRWDDAQELERRASRDKRKQRRQLRTSELQGNTSDPKDEDSGDDEKTSSKKTQRQVKFVNSKWNPQDEVSSDPKYIISPDEELAEEGLSSTTNSKTKAKTTTTTTSKKSAVFASAYLYGVNSSNQAYGGLLYAFPMSGGGDCPPFQRSCVGATSYYAEVEVYVDGSRTTGDYIGLAACGAQLCNSWDVPIPAQYHDGQSHTLNAYVVNMDGTQVATASGSPKTFSIAQSPEWTNANWDSSDDPGVQPGTPANNGTAGAGSGNFGFSAPIVSLPGRNGLNVNLSLNYNSLLWHKDENNNITYDIDKGNVAPGWNIGFGKILDMDTTGGAMLESANGTRHSYDGEIVGSGSNTTYYGRTTDGSFIDYIVERGPNGLISGEAWMPSGAKITYASENDGVLYPTQIKDANGNYITITYVGNAGPNINTITDTMGRVITFKYASGRLISVKGPGYNGTTQTFVRLHYVQKTLSATFSGLTKAVRNASPYQLKAIYYPVTNTGYWFGDSDSYSSYGMIKKVMMNRSMNSTGTDTAEGSATKGTMSTQSVYNYPASASNLTDAPKYTTKTDSWHASNTGAAVTSYSVNNSGSPRTTTITLPNGTKSKTYSYNTSDWKDGTLYQTEFLSSSNAVLSKQAITWALGYNGAPRVTQVLSTDEKNQTSKQTFTYGAYYNQVTSANQYGLSNNLLRKSYTTYDNTATYRGTYSGSKWQSGLHIFNLPLTSEVQNASSVRESRIDFTYDVGNLTARSGVSNFDTAYNTSSIKRGNVTKTKTYSNASNLTGAIEYFYTYDVLGNNITATTNCCQQITTTYNSTYKYAYPASVRRGLPTGSVDYNTNSATYDFNTGLVKTSVDYNARTTTATYDSIGRPTQVTLSTGGKTIYEYFPNTLTTIQTSKLANNTIVGKSTSIVNGRGQPIISKVLTGTTSETASTVKYDIMGRQAQASNPYPATSSPTKWTTYAYDEQSRVIQTTAPDGSTSKTFYNESTKPSSAASTVGSTVRSQDAWGRERWARSDDFGRLVEVVEPNAAGNGSVTASGNLVTRYTYDASDQLTQITQGSQIRKFKYDSLGRMTRQKLAEQTATINDAGTYVGTSGGLWSDAFEYDTRSNLTKRTDARGVKTTFDYTKSGSLDPLNRLQRIKFDKSGADTSHGTIEAVGDIEYRYMTTGDKERLNWILSHNINNNSSARKNYEWFGYDTEGRLYATEFGVYEGNNVPTRQMPQQYTYDTANRLTSVRYPTQYGMSGNPRKTVDVAYDTSSRLKDLKVGGVTQMDSIAYNDYGQATSIRIGGGSANPLTEQYSFDANTGLMTNQKVKRGSTSLMDLSYNYDRLASKGSLNGKTGNLTHIVDNLDRNKDRKYEYDTLGRLTKSLGGASAGGTGATANWTQNYTYDRYGNKKATTKSGITANSAAVPLDGLASQAYAATTNRITTSGHEYDFSGNMTRGKAPDGTLQRFEYDAAGRLVKIKTDAGALLEEYTYGASRERIKKTVANGDKTYYAWGGSSVIAEYTEAAAATTMSWAKSYVYAGSRLLSTITKNGAAETTEYHHPDKLGTKLVTNTSLNTAKSQSSLPFGTAISSETTATTNQKFTSYDRSGATGLDYAVNRTYNSGQSRFTQVDPIGMASASIGNPQSLNLFAYTQNNPVDFTDPTGENLNSCPAEFSSCGGGWDAGNPNGGGWGFGGGGNDSDRAYEGMSPTLRRLVMGYEERLQNTYDAIAATRALNQYLDSDKTDQKALNKLRALLESNSTLSIQVGEGTHAWIIPNVDKLEALIDAGGFDKCNKNGGKRYCAELPQDWSTINGYFSPGTDTWIMGAAVHPGLNIAPGTVLATFDRPTGKYLNQNSGNHVVIFLRWIVEKGRFYNSYSAQVLEQGPNWEPRKRDILYSRWTDSSYITNIWYYNVVSLKNK